MPRLWSIVALAALLAATGAACTPDGNAPRKSDEVAAATLPKVAPATLDAGEKLRVVATTNIVGDVVAQVGGDAIDLTALMGPGQDPHSFEPAARDLSTIETAHVVFTNGLGLEESLEETVEAVADGVPVVPVSAGVEVMALTGGDAHDQHDGGVADPHTWMDPHNVMIWTENVAAVLGALDPANAETYADNATAYVEELAALDAYIAAQADRIPPAEHKLVTNHESLGYFARRYGFEVVGTVYVGASQLAEPAAGDLAALIDTLKSEEVRAIFVETTVSEELAAVVADEVGYEVRVYTLYTGSLGEPGSGADSYLGMMRANIDTIVAGLAVN
jgi:ABC-type Zn uptake system ZnuABC Zn-binding protein ZnuA